MWIVKVKFTGNLLLLTLLCFEAITVEPNSYTFQMYTVCSMYSGRFVDSRNEVESKKYYLLLFRNILKGFSST